MPATIFGIEVHAPRYGEYGGDGHSGERRDPDSPDGLWHDPITYQTDPFYYDTSGNTHAMDDVWFDIDPTRTKPLTDIPIPDDIKALPEALGFGNVCGLRETMALDPRRQTRQSGSVTFFHQGTME